MKNLLKYSAFALVLLISFGCDEDIPGSINGQFVQLLADSDVTVTENSGDVVEIRALLGAPQSSDTTVNFDVTTTADASRYDLSATSVVIPAGETEGAITISPIDNDDIDGDVSVTISLSTSNSLPIGIGGEGASRVSRTINIVDDNIPCNDYVLTINTDDYGNETFWDIIDSDGMEVASDGLGTYPNSGLPNNSQETFMVSLEDGCYTLRVYDYWGDNGPTFTLACGALLAADDSDGLGGSATLDIATVPPPGFRGSPSSPYAGHVEVVDFCVNQ